VTDLRVQTASAMQASFNFKTRIVSADDTSYCQWMNGDFGISPFFGQIRQAMPACVLYLWC